MHWLFLTFMACKLTYAIDWFIHDVIIGVTFDIVVSFCFLLFNVANAWFNLDKVYCFDIIPIFINMFQHGYTPLHQAAQQGHTLVVNLLLENQASPNVTTVVCIPDYCFCIFFYSTEVK